MKKIWWVVVLVALAVAACGSEEADNADEDGQVQLVEQPDADPQAEIADSSESDGSGSTDTQLNNDLPDDEDAPEIVGNPDLDLDDLEDIAPDIAEALDGIDDIVSIGDCASETVGLQMTYVPDGWQCRVLDEPVAGLDGFTLFRPESPGGIEITVGTPSPLGLPCAVLQMCDTATPIDLGSNFDMEVVDFGVPLIYGTHTSVDSEVTVVAFAALSEEETLFVTMVLDGVEEM